MNDTWFLLNAMLTAVKFVPFVSIIIIVVI